MITVSISINGQAIITRSARNVGQDASHPASHRYLVDDGREILHCRDDGAVVLAKKLLDTVTPV